MSAKGATAALPSAVMLTPSWIRHEMLLRFYVTVLCHGDTCSLQQGSQRCCTADLLLGLLFLGTRVDTVQDQLD